MIGGGGVNENDSHSQMVCVKKLLDFIFYFIFYFRPLYVEKQVDESLSTLLYFFARVIFFSKFPKILVKNKVLKKCKYLIKFLAAKKFLSRILKFVNIVFDFCID